MGTTVATQVDAEKDNEESDFGNIGASDPVVYQLVRVFVCIACFSLWFAEFLCVCSSL